MGEMGTLPICHDLLVSSCQIHVTPQICQTATFHQSEVHMGYTNVQTYQMP